MSGGFFDYKDGDLKYEIFGFSDRPKNVFEDLEISEIVWDVLDLIHEYDWYHSGDTDESDYLNAKNEFKKKWLLTDSEDRLKMIVDKEIEELRKQLYKTIGEF